MKYIVTARDAKHTNLDRHPKAQTNVRSPMPRAHVTVEASTGSGAIQTVIDAVGGKQSDYTAYTYED